MQHRQRQRQDSEGLKLILRAIFKKNDAKLLDFCNVSKDSHHPCEDTAKGQASEGPEA